MEEVASDEPCGHQAGKTRGGAEIDALGVLILRSAKPDFKDKGILLTSLIAPIMLPVPCGSFPANVYESGFRSGGCGRFSLRQASAALIGLFVGLSSERSRS